MINLMPYDTKKQTAAARLNVMLLRFVVILGFAAGFLVMASSVTYLLLSNSKAELEKQQLKIDLSSNPIQKRATDFRNNLTISRSVLDRQISYGRIVMEVGKIMPAGTILDSLSVNDGSFGTTTTLKILSTSADNETRLKQNVEGSSVFSNYKFESTSSGANGNLKYPFVINVSLMINREGAAI
jgi:Tfp pilus assembly protein PilN